MSRFLPFLYKLVNRTFVKHHCNAKLHLQIDNGDIQGLDAPYLCICNHLSNNDVFILAQTIGNDKSAVFVASADQIAKHPVLYPMLGAVGKRQFAPQAQTVFDLVRQVKRKRIVALFPEGRLSVDGSRGYVNFLSLARLTKLLNVPVVCVTIYGAYLRNPRFSDVTRPYAVRSVAKRLFTAEQVTKGSVEQLAKELNNATHYDEYSLLRSFLPQYGDFNAQGLHKVLYQCPNCLSDVSMQSQGNTLSCSNCQSTYLMDEYGVLTRNGVGLTVPEWYAFERNNVRRSLVDGTFTFQGSGFVRILRGDSRRYDVDQAATFHYDATSGFTLSLSGQEEVFPPDYTYTCSFDAQECLILSKPNVTYRIYPTDDSKYHITQLHLAFEENFKLVTEQSANKNDR